MELDIGVGTGLWTGENKNEKAHGKYYGWNLADAVSVEVGKRMTVTLEMVYDLDHARVARFGLPWKGCRLDFRPFDVDGDRSWVYIRRNAAEEDRWVHTSQNVAVKVIWVLQLSGLGRGSRLLGLLAWCCSCSQRRGCPG